MVLGIVDYVKTGDSSGGEEQPLRDHELLRNGTTIAETVDGSTRFCKPGPIAGSLAFTSQLI